MPSNQWEASVTLVRTTSADHDPLLTQSRSHRVKRIFKEGMLEDNHKDLCVSKVRFWSFREWEKEQCPGLKVNVAFPFWKTIVQRDQRQKKKRKRKKERKKVNHTSSRNREKGWNLELTATGQNPVELIQPPFQLPRFFNVFPWKQTFTILCWGTERRPICSLFVKNKI